MKLFSRIRELFADSINVERLEATLAERDSEIARLRTREVQLASVIDSVRADLYAERAHGELLNHQLAERIAEIGNVRDLAQAAYAARDLAQRQLGELTASRAEIAAQLEEAVTRIALLESSLGDRASDDQLDLMHPPATADDAGSQDEADDEVLSDVTALGAYRVVGVFFEGRAHWQLARDDQKIKAPIHDQAFLERLHSREVFFAAGDTLRARIRTISRRRPNGDVYTEYSVESDTEILPPARQLTFDAAPASAEPSTTAVNQTGALS